MKSKMGFLGIGMMMGALGIGAYMKMQPKMKKAKNKNATSNYSSSLISTKVD